MAIESGGRINVAPLSRRPELGMKRGRSFSRTSCIYAQARIRDGGFDPQKTTTINCLRKTTLKLRPDVTSGPAVIV